MGTQEPKGPPEPTESTKPNEGGSARKASKLDRKTCPIKQLMDEIVEFVEADKGIRKKLKPQVISYLTAAAEAGRSPPSSANITFSLEFVAMDLYDDMFGRKIHDQILDRTIASLLDYECWRDLAVLIARSKVPYSGRRFVRLCLRKALIDVVFEKAAEIAAIDGGDGRPEGYADESGGN